MSNDSLGLRIELELQQNEFKADEKQILRFTLANESNRTMNILKWNTPLEGFDRDIFRIERDNTEAVYLGRVVKKGAPKAEDYITLKSNKSVTKEFDLTEFYDISKSGNYNVQYKPRLLDVGEDKPEILSKTLKGERGFNPQSVESNSVNFELTESREPKQINGILIETKKGIEEKSADMKVPGFTNCSADQQKTLKSAIAEAIKLVKNAIISLSSLPYHEKLSSPRYRIWFGNYSTGISQYLQRYNKVLSNYQKILDALDNKDIKLNCDCKENYFAYVYPTKPYQIWLCKSFWNAPLIGTDSKAGTIIHETSHFNVVVGTTDHVYGTNGCQQLASNDPLKASNNADSHEYYAENTPLLQTGVTSYRTVTLRASNNQYVVAEGGGGGVVNANRVQVGPWEKFTIIDVYGGQLMSGDVIHFQTWNGNNYLVAEGGGGKEVLANRDFPREWESFIIQKISGPGPINNGDVITLQSYNGNYVVAEGGGGGVVNANRTQVGPWEKFVIEFTS